MSRQLFILLLALLLTGALPAAAQHLPPAPIVNDEGGPTRITGSVTYTDPLFTAGVGEPLIILEDQAGFVDRNRYFIMSVESQVIGQITSDFFRSPFTYSLMLPIEPRGSLRDVDNNGSADTGVMIFAVAYWDNTWGDSFLEERDLFGGGWSTAYASTRVDQKSAENEVIGGRLLVYAPDDRQGFPSGFGADGLLFTADDPTVALPAGYTVVNLDTDPFTFDRSREVTIDLIEGERAAPDDFSQLGYTAAFDAMIATMRREYAFTELKGINWDALSAEYRPRMEQAEANRDQTAYLLALRDLRLAIPDGHQRMPLVGALRNQFQREVAGGLGLSLVELDDGRFLVNYLLPDGPAASAGIQLRAELLAINDRPTAAVVRATQPWSGPFSTKHTLRLQQLRYALRFPLGTEVSLTFRNPGADPQTVRLRTVNETESFNVSSFNTGLTGLEVPVEYRLIEGRYMYVKVYSFFDDSRLTISLWERMIQTLNEAGVPGLIIDMRQNGGGSGFLANQMAAYFFDQPLELGITGSYDEKRGEFYFDPRGTRRFILPTPDKRYRGPVAVLIGPNCNSACEFFTYAMTLQDRAAVVGQYPTSGMAGGQAVMLMPDGVTLQWSVSRTQDSAGNILIEGRGVAPTVRVPVDETTAFSSGDPILEAAVAHLDRR